MLSNANKEQSRVDTHSWRCKAKSSGHIGFADRISMPGPAGEMAISRPLPMAFAELANPVRQERGAPQQGYRGIHIYTGTPPSSTRKSPIIRYQGIPCHQKLPGSCANIRNSRIPAPRTRTWAKPIESIKKNHMLRYKTYGSAWRLKKDSNLQPFG